MIKRISLILVTVLLTAVLCSCGGNIKHAKKEIGPSGIYTPEEIESAMDVAMDYFDKEFEGCTLLEIYYDEAKSYDAAGEYEERWNAQVIILYSSFDVDSGGGDGSFNPNSTYNGWSWILSRTDNGEWTLRDWGY